MPTKIVDFDILGISETWLDTIDKHLPAEVSIQGYKNFPVNNSTPSKRGGEIDHVCQEFTEPNRNKVATTHII